MSDKRRIPEPNECVPRYDNAVARFIGRTFLKLCGWKLGGEFPKEKQLVLCAAPHTSNWDFIFAMLFGMAYGVKFSYLMKKEAFVWPMRGLFLKLGGIPIDRSASNDTVAQIATWFSQHEQVWLAITPEGTRAKVEKWKTGFLRIAEEAEVPILLICWHYPDKTLYLDKLWQPSGRHDQDAAEIREYINSKFIGAYPERQ